MELIDTTLDRDYNASINIKNEGVYVKCVTKSYN